MPVKVALIQMTSGSDIAANIAALETFVAQAAGQGAELIATPENTFLMESPYAKASADKEPGAPRTLYTLTDHPGVAAASAMAKKHGVWLLIGSIAVIPSEAEGSLQYSRKDPSAGLRSAQDDKIKAYNRSLLFDPHGTIAAHYDKIHLFDVDVGDGHSYRESARYLPGAQMVTADVVVSSKLQVASKESVTSLTTCNLQLATRLGMTVCYDVRFPHLYRALAKGGAQILAVPSAFTAVTGEAHWHVLLRARAIENGCFVIAPAQTGTHPGNRKTYGHSLVVGPWGNILADGGTEPGIVIAEIDLDEVSRVRKKLPSLEHDREFSASS